MTTRFILELDSRIAEQGSRSDTLPYASSSTSDQIVVLDAFARAVISSDLSTRSLRAHDGGWSRTELLSIVQGMRFLRLNVSDIVGSCRVYSGQMDTYAAQPISLKACCASLPSYTPSRSDLLDDLPCRPPCLAQLPD